MEEERKLLGEEADQLKLLLKRELNRLEAELRTKDTVIADYKAITRVLQHKLDTTEGKVEEEGADVGLIDTAVERVRELELELAQTKLALVETECKNQDLTHQFSVAQVSPNNSSSLYV